MNDIRFTKTNGGMARASASEDPISALIMPIAGADGIVAITSNFKELESGMYVAKFQYAEQLREMGLEYSDPEDRSAISVVDATALFGSYHMKSGINALVYHVSEFFRMNPNGTLYVGIVNIDIDTPTHEMGYSVTLGAEDDIASSCITEMQNYAEGKIRQVGILTPSLGNLADYQTEATSLEGHHKPLSIVVTPTGFVHNVSVRQLEGSWSGLYITASSVSELELSELKDSDNTMVANGQCNVSVLIGCDLDETLAAKLGTYKYYGCIGTCLGAISKAAVNECIAWVQKFPLGLAKPGLISGEEVKNVSEADLNDLNTNHLIFVRTHVGITDCYFNDSWTLDLDTSDYAYIESVRTIDKACRGVRANLLPYLNSPLKVDAETGKFAQSTVAFLQTTAGRALEDMEKADELSGYVVEIDPEQNVISTSMLQVVIKQVPTGVMRNVNIKIGFTTALN